MDFDLSDFEKPLKDRIVATQPEEVTKPPIKWEIGFNEIQWKMDGHRVLVDYRDGVEPKILNRKGSPYSAAPFKVQLPDAFKGCVLDGEFFQKHQRYFVFDLLGWDGELKLHKTREERLVKLFVEIAPDSSRYMLDHTDPVIPVHTAYGYNVKEGRGVVLLVRYVRGDIGVDDNDSWLRRINEMIEMGKQCVHVDGLIFRRTDDPYFPGETSAVKKFKFVSDIDCHVTAVGIDDKSNCELSVYDPISDQHFAVGKASTNGKGRIAVGNVVRVRFLKFTGSRLREPRIVEVRDDKSPLECTVDQLIPFTHQLAETSHNQQE